MLTLVLLPGMDGTGDLFDPVISALGSNLKTIIIRYPFTLPLNYSELETFVREALPKNEPFIVLGESFSGPIAISIAASPPSGLFALILCCSFARNPQPILRLMTPFLPFLPIKYIPTKLLSYFLLGKFATPLLCSLLSTSLSKVTHSTLITRMRSVLKINVTNKLSKISIPVLYLCAAQDRTVPKSASKLIAKLLPQTQITLLNAPHFLLQTNPKEAASVINSFILKHKNF